MEFQYLRFFGLCLNNLVIIWNLLGRLLNFNFCTPDFTYWHSWLFVYIVIYIFSPFFLLFIFYMLYAVLLYTGIWHVLRSVHSTAVFIFYLILYTVFFCLFLVFTHWHIYIETAHFIYSFHNFISRYSGSSRCSSPYSLLDGASFYLFLTIDTIHSIHQPSSIQMPSFSS